MLRSAVYVMCLAAGSTSAFAELDSIDTPTTQLMSPTIAEDAGPALEGIYTVSENTPIIPRAIGRNGEIKENRNLTVYTIDKNDHFALSIEGDKVILTPLIASESQGKTADRFEFKARDLANAGFEYVAEGDRSTLYQNFSESADTQVAVGACKTLVERHFGFHVAGACASQMSARELAQVGFHSASCQTAQLQVWGGGYNIAGVHGCGHVAWRQGNTWSSGDLVGNPGRNFYSEGCYSRGS